MSTAIFTEAKELTIPSSIMTRADLSRLTNEMEHIDSELASLAVRTTVGETKQPNIRASDQLIAFLQANRLRLTEAKERTQLIAQLRKLKETSPIVHLTFAANADSESLQKIILWLRVSVHVHSLLSVGIQPSLVAGVYVRTPNRVLDLSLRAKFEQAHGSLVSELGALDSAR